MEICTKTTMRRCFLATLFLGAGMLCASVQAHEQSGPGPADQGQSGSGASSEAESPGLLQAIRKQINAFLVQSRATQDTQTAGSTGYGVGYESRMGSSNSSGGLGGLGGGNGSGGGGGSGR